MTTDKTSHPAESPDSEPKGEYPCGKPFCMCIADAISDRASESSPWVQTSSIRKFIVKTYGLESVYTKRKLVPMLKRLEKAGLVVHRRNSYAFRTSVTEAQLLSSRNKRREHADKTKEHKDIEVIITRTGRVSVKPSYDF